MAEVETSGTILARTVALIRANALPAAIALIGLAAADTVLDSVPRQSFAVSGIVSLIAQYALIAAALRKLGLMSDIDGHARFFPLFGLLLVGGLATLVGFVLLIVPGVILVVRWSIIVPIFLAERTTIGEALRQSWQRTAGRFWPIFGVLAIYLAVLIVASGVAVLLFEGNAVATFATNLLINAAVVAQWYATIAIYEHGRSASHDLEEVFA